MLILAYTESLAGLCYRHKRKNLLIKERKKKVHRFLFFSAINKITSFVIFIAKKSTIIVASRVARLELRYKIVILIKNVAKR
jgi:hypothetical protein